MSRIPKFKTPSQWDLVKLLDICKLRKGNHLPNKNGNLKYIGLEHIDSGDPRIQRYGYENEVVSAQHKFYLGDILYGKLRPYLDKAVLTDSEGICSSDILVIQSKRSEALPDYLINILHSKRFLNYIISTMSGTTLPRTNWKDISKYKLNLPRINEQRKIVSILSNVDDLTNKTNEIIERLKTIKKGLMQRLFTEGIGHSEFKDTKLGKIPKEWDIVNFSTIGKVLGGGTPDTKQKEYWNGEILWATPTDITNNESKYIHTTTRTITKKGLNKSSAKILPPNSLLLTSRATIGYCAINLSEICTNQGFQNIIPNEKIDVEFLYYLIQSNRIQNQLLRNAYGSTFLEIPNKDVKKIKIMLPNKIEQKKISFILSNIDILLLSYRNAIKINKLIKKGLIQDLLTGKKRVKIS